MVLADRSGMGSVYKGIAIASDGGADFLFAADFKKIGEKVLEVFVAQRFLVVNRHYRFAPGFKRTQLVLLKQVQLFAGIEHLQGELVLVQHHAAELGSIRGHDQDRFILLGEFLHRFEDALRELAARVAHRFHEVLRRARRAHRGEIRAKAASLPFDHVARGATETAVEEFFPVLGISRGLRRGFRLHRRFGAIVTIGPAMLRPASLWFARALGAS